MPRKNAMAKAERQAADALRELADKLAGRTDAARGAEPAGRPVEHTAAKPDEPPLISFPAQVPGLGPSEMKSVTVDVPAKLRAYELPDWQYLIAHFQITDPQ